MIDRVDRPLRSLRSERGMTVVEVMVAALILVLGSLAVLSLVASGARTNYRAEQGQVVSDRLQEEMEKIKQLANTADYTRIALTAAPASSADVNHPDYRVSGTTYNVAPNGSSFQPMVLDPSGLPPVSTFARGDVSGTIHRYVVWEPDTVCTECKKRVIVAIQLDATGTGGVRHYQELQSVIGDPRAPDRDNPIPPPDGEATPWTFWLTDTPCNYPDRQSLTGNHTSHNTRGLCSDGLKDLSNCSDTTGCEPGAPDLMVTHPPVISGETPLFNFATDVLSPNPSQDKGLRLLRPSANGCPAGGGTLDQPLTNGARDTANPTRYYEIHKWVSPPIPDGFNVELESDGLLTVWTRAVGNAPYLGRLCVWLFARSVDGSGTVDTPAVNLDTSATHFEYQASPWPKPKWEEVPIPLHLDLPALTPGTRLGLAIQVEKATNGGGLQFFYDEPSYETRLELHSNSTLPTLP